MSTVADHGDGDPRRPAGPPRRRLGAAQHQPLHRRRARRGAAGRDAARQPAGGARATLGPGRRRRAATWWPTGSARRCSWPRRSCCSRRSPRRGCPAWARASPAAAAAAAPPLDAPVAAVSARPRVAVFLAPVARHARPHRPGRGARLRVRLGLRLAAALPRPVRRRSRGPPTARRASGWASACVVPGLRAPGRHRGRRCARWRRSRRAGCAPRWAPGSRAASRSGWGRCRSRRLEREVDDLRGLLAGEERAHAEGGAPIRDMPVPGAEGDGDGAALRLVPRPAGPGARPPTGATAR